MAMSRSHGMLRVVRGLPQSSFLPDNPLRCRSWVKPDCSANNAGKTAQDERPCVAPNLEGPPGVSIVERSLGDRHQPYWLGVEQRMLTRAMTLKTSPLWAHSSALPEQVGADISTAPVQRSMQGAATLRGFGSEAGALRDDEEVPVWRRQEASSGLITEGSPSQTAGGTSKCRSISFGCATMQGKKETMDDRLTVQFSLRGNRHLGFFGAFDGHGGWSVADYAAHKLHRHIFNSPLAGTSLPEAMIDAYARTDEEVLTFPGRLAGEYGPDLVGSTATTAVVDLGRGQLVVGNVGDSRAVLCRAGRAVRLTAEHTVTEESERERIEGSGGDVVAGRLSGILNVSRALGDSDLKRWVVSDPFVRELQLTSEDAFMVLATDGLWDVISNEGAVEVAEQGGDAQTAAQMLMEEAMMRRARDDVACLVVYFHWAR
ncbi:protein phosphatase 2C [Klebsormidium nitens]|uniref:Protein phosphatase 2C n=1 Tax=Klebsormidium nitens TaxID=105231 RepID=A0A1Y1HW33_KLENI|nr:protein phosphatase 2C [Klebsormidium nitens]|eukprot:GAQ82850.1 protein phosphatase 2C [Klebsormidium nitens]